MVSSLLHLFKTPSSIDKCGSGINRDGLICLLKPKPPQASQAPVGELNENSLGSKFAIE